ncbi:MAG: PAS domain S-box protein [Gammaproteobacteria bacterium]|nr:PAS domain S-box protein [Gammaproteobacteria bacterium]
MSTIPPNQSIATKTLNEALERSEKALHELKIQKLALDHHAIVSMTDPQGRITYANERFCAITKYSQRELIGKDHCIINSGHHSKEFFLDLWRTITSGKVWQGEICNRTKDGKQYWVQSTIVPLPELDGKLQGYISIRTDITKRKLLEEQNLFAMKELECSNRELDAFAYIASHDLKEPLRGIHNYSQFLLEDYSALLDDEGCDKLETLKRLAQRMDDLIGTLLRFSRVGRTKLDLSPVNIGDLARETCNALQAAIDEAGAQVEVAADLPDVVCDPVLAGQIFQNLIANAIKYRGRDSGQVEVGWDGDPWRPVFHVRDDGIGIREKDFKSIFRIFKRLHGQDKYGGGLGAGLTFARKIVEHHGGRIWVESQSSEGSIFYFTLS